MLCFFDSLYFDLIAPFSRLLEMNQISVERLDNLLSMLCDTNDIARCEGRRAGRDIFHSPKTDCSNCRNKRQPQQQQQLSAITNNRKRKTTSKNINSRSKKSNTLKESKNEKPTEEEQEEEEEESEKLNIGKESNSVSTSDESNDIDEMQVKKKQKRLSPIIPELVQSPNRFVNIETCYFFFCFF